MTAKSKAIAEYGVDFHLACRVGYIIEIAYRIGKFVVDRGRDDPFAHCLNAERRLNCPAGPEHVSGRPLG